MREGEVDGVLVDEGWAGQTVARSVLDCNPEVGDVRVGWGKG